MGKPLRFEVPRCRTKPCPKITKTDKFMDDSFDSFQLSEGCFKVILWKKGTIKESQPYMKPVVDEEKMKQMANERAEKNSKRGWAARQYHKTKDAASSLVHSKPTKQVRDYHVVKVAVDGTMPESKVNGLARDFSEEEHLSDPNLDNGFEDDVFRMDIFPKAVCEEPAIGQGC